MFKDNLLKIRKRIAIACSRVNRNPEKIEIVAVSKGRTVSQIEEAVAAGINDIGENRVQEAREKYNLLNAKRSTCLAHGSPHGEAVGRRALNAIKWHLVGHLQTNKVKTAVEIFDLIHSVDSISLAREIDKEAANINKVQDILIEVKTSPEAAKFGINPEEAIEVIKEVARYKNLSIKGLMTIAPVVDNPEKARPYFRMLRELMAKINELRITNYELRILSIGMTDDFEAAIVEGADMLRLGRAIFEG